MKDNDFKLLRGFADVTDEQTDICDCRVAFAAKKSIANLRMLIFRLTL